jgi:2-(1,2-epoxy-1,2-dihydrophenyl)acetyl-CoA isomerase
MDFETIRFATTEGVGVITLDRPERMNALNGRMRAEITAAVEAAPGAGARVLVLTGSGRAFCSGQDLTDAFVGAGDLERVLRDEYEPMLKAIAACPVPVIAAVNGAAAGAGANLALGCDVVIAADSAVFLQAFTRIGLIPDAGGTWLLPRQVGFARAMGAMLFAEPVPARQAVAWGMIWEAVPDDAFAAHWRARAAALAEGPTLAYGALKAAVRAGMANGFEAQLAVEARLQADCGLSEDFREGVAAFLEKRRARFEGR